MRHAGGHAGALLCAVNFQLTDHAVDRYLERVDSTVSRADAVRCLEDALKTATRMRELSKKGHPQLFVGGPPAFIIIFKERDRRDKNPQKAVIVATVRLPDVEPQSVNTGDPWD